MSNNLVRPPVGTDHALMENSTRTRSGRQRPAAAKLLGVLTLLIGLLIVVPATASAAAPCAVDYKVTTYWGTGMQAQIVFSPGVAVTSWSIAFDIADQQVVAFTSNGGFTQTGRHVTVSNASFNGTVSATGSVTLGIGIHTNPTLTNIPPAAFSYNGQTCSYTPQPYLIAAPTRPVVAEGGTAVATVVLSRAPTVNITVTVGGGSVVAASPSTLVFTPANWNVPQTLTLRSPTDSDTTSQDQYIAINQQNYTIPMYVSTIIMAHQADNG